jgi:hypothetical protein
MTKNSDTELIVTHAKANNLAGYHITTFYTKAETATIATKYLKHALPYLFDGLIGNDWRRKNVSDAFALFAFLYEPESRVRPQPDQVRIGTGKRLVSPPFDSSCRAMDRRSHTGQVTLDHVY